MWLEPLTSSNSFIIAVDANASITKEGTYTALAANVGETAGGLSRENIQITRNSPLSTTRKGELDGTSISFNSEQGTEIVHFKRIGNDYFMTLSSMNFIPIFLPQNMLEPNSVGVMADLDYIVQTVVRRALGWNIRPASSDLAIKDVWRQFRTIIKKNKKHV